MKLKYADFIDKFENCIAAEATASNREAYRWTFDQITDKRNFIPRYLSSSYEELEKIDCIGYALSMFDTEEQAIAKLKTLSKNTGKSFKKLGTHIAKGKLSSSDGLSGKSSSDQINYGHFSFFEFEGTQLSEKFKITNQIII